MDENNFTRQLLTVEELSKKTHLPVSLFQLAIDCGCPKTGGKIRYRDFSNWLVDNYAALRAKAGLTELPEVDGLPESIAGFLSIGNSMLTIIDYMKSRTSSEGLKKISDNVAKKILKMMDEGERPE